MEKEMVYIVEACVDYETVNVWVHKTEEGAVNRAKDWLFHNGTDMFIKHSTLDDKQKAKEVEQRREHYFGLLVYFDADNEWFHWDPRTGDSVKIKRVELSA